MSATPFGPAELQRALTEQTFAIANSMISSTPPAGEARARIVLLEGSAIDIQLTMRGFTIVGASNSDSDPESESATVYETLEDLLRAVSPLYTAKEQEAIVERLTDGILVKADLKLLSS